MKRIIGYVRVSTGKQDKERQRDLINEYCNNNGYECINIIGENISGVATDRKIYQQILYIDNSIADVLVVSEMSRLSREDDILKVLNELNTIINNGLDVLFLDEPNKIYKAGKTFSMLDIITLTVKAQANADERKRIALRTKTGKYTVFKKKGNSYLGGHIPYGFNIIDNPGYEIHKSEPVSIIIPDEKNIVNVKLMYDMIIQGNTLYNIATHLNKIGIKNTYSNKKFTESTVYRIIKNPIYYGKRMFKDIQADVNEEWKPIITEDIYNKAIYRLKTNQLFKSKGKNFNPLKGLIKCPCGYSMQYSKRKNDLESKFICRNKEYNHYPTPCKNGGINANYILPAIWESVKQTISLSKYYLNNEEATIKFNKQIEILKQQRDIKVKERDNVLNEKNKAITAIKNTTLKSIINKLELEYIEFENEEFKLNKDIDNLNNEINILENNKLHINRMSLNKDFSNITDEEKREIYINELEKIVYYSVTTMKGYIVISYKNGFENIIALRKNGKRFVSLLPSGFKFNIENRTVSVNAVDNNTKPLFPNVRRKEYTFKEMEKAFNMYEWDLNIIDPDISFRSQYPDNSEN